MKQMIVFFALALFLQGALGELVCEELPSDMCSFSIASSGQRCVLETYQSDNDETVRHKCKTSDIMANVMHPHIESDECIKACGVYRDTIGIASDSLLETPFTSTLCSPVCYDNCPNIVDVYYNLALAEGVILSELCTSQRISSRRSLIQSSSAVASSPVSAAAGPTYVAADAPASATTLSSVDCAPAPM